jgi:galactokinase
MQDTEAIQKLKEISSQIGIDINGAKIRRTSSRFCLGVEHGDYNGTELFGVGTDRFIWFAYKPNGTNKNRLYSANFPNEGVVEFECGKVPQPKSEKIVNSWMRFPFGVDYILNKRGYKLSKGFDGIIFGNIPGGGMSRSASLTLNLILTMMEVNGIKVPDDFKIVDMAQEVENEYIGSPCGQLDQIMILFAKANMGTHYNPAKRTIDYIPLGKGGEDLRIVVMDTGTDRPGLDKSTYKIRRTECEELVKLAQAKGFKIKNLADIKDEKLFNDITATFKKSHPGLCDRLNYIYKAQKRFYKMLEAWRKGDIETVGSVFREDGLGLRDEYKISGPELEAMCDIVREVPGVLGERMLGGGDKGASGALVKSEAVEKVKQAVELNYPKMKPDYAKKFAVHTCKIVDGVKEFNLEG